MNITELMYKILVKVEGAHYGSDSIVFTTSDGEVYQMTHTQECCESVTLDDVCGDVDDILESPITLAEEVDGDLDGKDGDGSYTWTFYKLATIKGYVTLRWYGSSNGCYSEDVEFCKIRNRNILQGEGI